LLHITVASCLTFASHYKTSHPTSTDKTLTAGVCLQPRHTWFSRYDDGSNYCISGGIYGRPTINWLFMECYLIISTHLRTTAHHSVQKLTMCQAITQQYFHKRRRKV